MNTESQIPAKTITGRIGKKAIPETITYYNPNQPEQVLTAKRNIRRRFEDQGYDPDSVLFDD